MTKSKNMEENVNTVGAADRIKTAALNAAKGLSRAQAERAATAAARNVNAYGQKEEGPSRWQEKKVAKRQMYLMSTEKAVKLGTRKEDRTCVMSQQCQKCLQIGHWTYDCKNDRTYMSRSSRIRLLKNPQLRPQLSLGETSNSFLRVLSEEILNTDNTLLQTTMKNKKRWREGPKDNNSDSDGSGSPPDSGTSESEESSSRTATSSGTFSSSTNSTPSRTSSSSQKSTNSTVSINTPPDSEDEEGTHPSSCPRGSKEEYRGLTTEGARKKRQMKLSKAITKVEKGLKKRKKKRRKSKK
ncbi:hypothetical protein R1flu_009541 [Riccia fluitans]|uniref:Zinc finger CCHC domain-containing protein 10 n=1 Tax=Riccia fluitans TaxID=41844 RepID=A0ABD1Z2E3_9MARC